MEISLRIIVIEFRAEVGELLHELRTLLNQLRVSIHQHIDSILVAFNTLSSAITSRGYYVDNRTNDPPSD